MTAADTIPGNILEVAGLRTYFFTRTGVVKAVEDISFTLRRGETLALVGESGCGKSMTALSIMRLVPTPPGRIVAGSVRLDGRDLLQLDEDAMRDVRGNEISMIFQEPMTSLNPVMTIGDQIGEAIRLHQDLPGSAVAAKAVEMLRLVHIPEPAQRAAEYPHQLSGGMRQRAMIAMALACNPKVLVADEPTTALDVTIQAQILELILELQRELGTALILITHDLGDRRGNRAARDRDVCRAQGRGNRRGGAICAAAASVHPRPARIDSAPAIHARQTRGRRRAARGNSGHGAGADQPAAGLSVRAALRPGRPALPR